MNQVDKDILRTFLIFEATNISMTTIIDKYWRQRTKQYFNCWYNQGKKIWKEILFNLKDKTEGEICYDELSAFLYEVCNHSLDKVGDFDKERFIEYIKNFK